MGQSERAKCQAPKVLSNAPTERPALKKITSARDVIQGRGSIAAFHYPEDLRPFPYNRGGRGSSSIGRQCPSPADERPYSQDHNHRQSLPQEPYYYLAMGQTFSCPRFFTNTLNSGSCNQAKGLERRPGEFVGLCRHSCAHNPLENLAAKAGPRISLRPCGWLKNRPHGTGGAFIWI